MRIVSLVPSATEILFELGLGDDIVGVTHECDHPPLATTLPRVTEDVLEQGLTSAQIDAAVKERTTRGEAIYSLDREMLHELAPDLIVTQALCPVCAVSYDDVVAIAEEIASKPQVISLDSKTVGEVLGDVRTLAQATGCKDQAVELVQAAADRIDRVKLGMRKIERPKVLALEWFDPPYIAGHWIPQMIDLAGGIDVAGLPGEHSECVSWEMIEAYEPEIIVAMPCGYDAARSLEEAEMYADRLQAIGAERIVAVNASNFFSRPSLRLVEGLETLAHIIHPEVFIESPSPVLTLDL